MKIGYRGIAALLLLVALAQGAAQAAGKQDAAERYIRESEAQWAEESVTNDATILKRILADDYLGVSSSSQVVTKAQQVDEALTAKMPSDFLSNKVDAITVHFYSRKLAVAQGSESWELRSGEKGRYIWVDTWLLRNGLWQIIASQDTRLPPAN